MTKVGDRVKIYAPFSNYNNYIGIVKKIDSYVWVRIGETDVAFYPEHIKTSFRKGHTIVYNDRNGVILELDKKKETAKIRFDGMEMWVMVDELKKAPKYKIKKGKNG
jgi:hypothetical protein